MGHRCSKRKLTFFCLEKKTKTLNSVQNVVAVGIIILLIRWCFILRQSRAPSQTLLAGRGVPGRGWERLGGRSQPASPSSAPVLLGGGPGGLSPCSVSGTPLSFPASELVLVRRCRVASLAGTLRLCLQPRPEQLC